MTDETRPEEPGSEGAATVTEPAGEGAETVTEPAAETAGEDGEKKEPEKLHRHSEEVAAVLNEVIAKLEPTIRIKGPMPTSIPYRYTGA